MIITVDMGNTNICIGLHQKGSLVATFRLFTSYALSSDSYKTSIKEFFKEHQVEENVEGAIISSVVPALTFVIAEALTSLFNIKPMIIGHSELKTGLKIKIDNPKELGADILADIVGGKEIYHDSFLVVDLGTATKLLICDDEGSYCGGIIVPGLKLSIEALVKATALLPDINLMAPKNIIGKNSFDAMNSGAIYGHIAMINGLTTMIENELGYKLKKLLTGGYAKLVKDRLLQYTFEENLIHIGLLDIYLRNEKNNETK